MKHDPQTNPSSDINEENGNSFSDETINPIIPRKDFLPQTDTSQGYSFPSETENQDISIQSRAKAFKPGIKSVVDLLDSTGVKVLSNVARKEGWQDDDIDELQKRVRMEGDTYAIIVDSGSRIAARYVKSDEYVDWACLIGGLTQWSMTLIAAIKEIKNNSQYEIVEETVEDKPAKPDKKK